MQFTGSRQATNRHDGLERFCGTGEVALTIVVHIDRSDSFPSGAGRRARPAPLVLAQGPGGLGLIDISNPANPSMLIGGSGGGSNTSWATRVKTIGNRIYSNRGAALRVQALTDTLTLANVADVAIGDWIVDIAVDAWRCIVGTDGSGIVTLEVTADGVLEKARITKFAFPREIPLAGNTVWIAASEDGLAAIDITNLAAPTALGSKKFKKDANSLMTSRNGLNSALAGRSASPLRAASRQP
ncbi:LVIVD repeat-containing protein [Nocardia salmonicida]|uniref:hypothetical protein n=1 Tax=Nocardia salmonicida TaxID=53431 RepID=UPI00362704EF